MAVDECDQQARDMKRSQILPVVRLLSKVSIRGYRDCWPWIGSIGTWGYGCFTLNGTSINASRAAYILLVGEVSASDVVCHSCDNPACCNPAHLWIGTQGDNIRDCNAKGRAKGTFTSTNHPRHCAKLTPSLINDARTLYAQGISQTEIGRRFGIHSSAISRALRGETFKGVA